MSAGLPDRVQQTLHLQLVRLLQLGSPGLPIGGYSYSQGLEPAVAAGVVGDGHTAQAWIGTLLKRMQARLEAPLWLLAHEAWCAGRYDALVTLNQLYLASRETAALREETRQMGWSLWRLSEALDCRWPDCDALHPLWRAPCLPVVFAGCAALLGLAPAPALTTYLFAWLEGQVIALQKLLPVGQTAAQAMLTRLAANLPDLIDEAQQRAHLGLAGLENFAPHAGILAARHQFQYSRLFRT